jgi:DNA-binding response OmpR family regulator
MSSKTILVVDDYQDLRKLVAFFLSARGYEVLEAPSGRTAIHAAIEGDPNLILLDLRLPDMNGIDVARELQKIPKTAHIPVIAWTADYRAKPNRDTLLQSGLFDCIQKPVSLRELEAAVARCLNSVSR